MINLLNNCKDHLKIKKKNYNLKILNLINFFLRHNLMKRRLNTTKNVYSNLSKDNDLSLVSITEIPKTETLRHDSFIKKQSIIFENKKNAEVLTETNNSRKSSIASLKKTNVVDQIDYGNDKKEFSQNLTSESESPISPIKSNETQKLFNNHVSKIIKNLLN